MRWRIYLLCQLGIEKVWNTERIAKRWWPLRNSHNLIGTSESMIVSRRAAAELERIVLGCWQQKCFRSYVGTITDSHGYHTKKDNGVDITTYYRSGKVIDPTVCSLLCHRMADHRGSGSVSPIMTFLSKWHNLIALHTRPGLRSNHD
jgi:hypothetical protein